MQDRGGECGADQQGKAYGGGCRDRCLGAGAGKGLGGAISENAKGQDGQQRQRESARQAAGVELAGDHRSGLGQAGKARVEDRLGAELWRGIPDPTQRRV